jgi:hypothetical protein
LKISVGGITHLLKNSEEWERETLTLLKSEIAWEVNTSGDAVTSWYMLMGDGYPVNGGERPPYTRLRVILNDFPIKPEGKSLNSLISYINRILSDIEALQQALAAETAAREAADNAEAAAREAADNALRQSLDAETAEREAAGNALRQSLDAETAARESGDLVLSYEVDDMFKLVMDTAAGMTRFVDIYGAATDFTYERAVDKGFGMEEYREADNAGIGWDSPFVTDQEYNTLYDFVMSLSGDNILQLDVDMDIERKPNRSVDKEGNTDDIRTLDSVPDADAVWVDLG